MAQGPGFQSKLKGGQKQEEGEIQNSREQLADTVT